jgi:hypothetical protein
MNSIISPVAPFQVTPVKSKALYRYDLAALLSSVLKLQGGVAIPWKNNAPPSVDLDDDEEKKRKLRIDDEIQRLSTSSSLKVFLYIYVCIFVCFV